ncbi:UAA transporter [Choiromyces venosus 120613-1]|uniref:UAA transporter n=1 Tax=Choiromyces venosus 120613-1 TaxID=1336337 RepID=A0A3N4JVZ0_9PEZI|nr:UAA transporter [Choiromyces venosus 120613-1]
MARGAQRRKSASEDVAEINKIDARPHLEGRAPPPTRSAIGAIAQATIPMWIQTAVMIGLIFGGCCSNVSRNSLDSKKAALAEPQTGHLLTFAQFLFVAVEGLIYHFDPRSKTLLRPNQIPIHRWLIQILLYFSVSILNNYAFGYSISVPVHIILRSGGSMTTLVIGWLWGKRYNKFQVLSVLILTVGIVLSAWGDSKGVGQTEESMTRFITGLAILFIAQVISAFMGLYVEGTYTRYGNHYREGLFYSHFLSLFLFTPFIPSIQTQYHKLLKSPPLPLPTAQLPQLSRIQIPRQVFFLLLNAATHYVCVRGVNVLASRSSALTVTIVLNIRKLVSLLLSIWLFGNALNWGVVMGAVVVFGGGFMYAVESQRIKAVQKRDKDQ